MFYEVVRFSDNMGSNPTIIFATWSQGMASWLLDQLASMYPNINWGILYKTWS